MTGVGRLPRTGSPRDPVNDVYDHGADLVQAAAALRRGAGEPGVARAAAAVIGCIESALRDLGEAAAELERSSSATCAQELQPGKRWMRMHQGFTNLEVALDDAADAAAAARSLTARALDAPGRQ
jgi:hypothetical protein